MRAAPMPCEAPVITATFCTMLIVKLRSEASGLGVAADRALPENGRDRHATPFQETRLHSGGCHRKWVAMVNAKLVQDGARWRITAVKTGDDRPSPSQCSDIKRQCARSNGPPRNKV